MKVSSLTTIAMPATVRETTLRPPKETEPLQHASTIPANQHHQQ